MSTGPNITGEPYGLGDPAMLGKIDKLFACGVGDLVDLPQIVVVGDQSSGKSSVLEGLIRKPLPRDSGLCTRFATQIVFRRSAEEHISVSIIPARDADDDHRKAVESWTKPALQSLEGDDFEYIMKEVHDVMGLAHVSDPALGKPTFSNDVLRLEIAGPDQEHLSVIDVPGIFKNTTPGLTTKTDIQLVREMVLSYMENPRSVMLVVVPSNVDVATQEILELAKDVDPDGDRTLGVLTKPDLVDKGAERRVVDLIEGRARPMKLGWHLVRNPGQKELDEGLLSRQAIEDKFFRTEPAWQNLEADKFGVESLRFRLKDVLSTLVRKEFPKVKQEIARKLTQAKQQLALIGPERPSAPAQAAYLTEIATKFQRLVTLALDAKYGSEEFDQSPALRLAPDIAHRMKEFSDDMASHGQTYPFTCKTNSGFDPSEGAYPDQPLVEESTTYDGSCDTRCTPDIDEIADILHPNTILSVSSDVPIVSWIAEVYHNSRGFDLGTFDNSILASTMREQSRNWVPISLGFISDVITMEHQFISAALDVVCQDKKVRASIDNLLLDDLRAGYTQAKSQVEFLLKVERNGRPMTLNHYFNDNLEKCRQSRMLTAMEKLSEEDIEGRQVVYPRKMAKHHHMSNEEYVIEDIRDILASYYKVARKRFADNVLTQAVDHFLLTGPQTPLTLFSPVFVARLSPEDLEAVAGELPAIKRKRAQLSKEISSLDDAMSIIARG